MMIRVCGVWVGCVCVQPRWESERTRDFKAPYAERGPHAAPAAQRSLPSLTQDAVHFWDAVQLPRGDGPIRLPPTPAQFRKPYPPPVSLDPAAPTQQQHHKHKHKGQTQPHQQVQQRPSAEASAPAVMGVVRSPRGGGGGSGGGSAVEEETVRADLIGKPAMAPPLAHQVKKKLDVCACELAMVKRSSSEIEHSV
jgi:hypothetical protein